MRQWILAGLAVLFTLAALGAAGYMIYIDVAHVQPLDTSLQVRPDPLRGNEYAGYMGIVMFAAGSAMLCFKHAFGYDPMKK